MGDRFGSGMFEALKSLVHRKKKDADPQYDGSNPKNEEQVIKDLQKLGVIKTENKTSAEQRDEALLKGKKLGIAEKELDGLDLRQLKDRVQRRETMVQTRIKDFVDEVREEVPTAKPDVPDTNPLRPEHKALIADQEARTEEMEKIGQDSVDMRRKRDRENLKATREALGVPQPAEETPKDPETRLDAAIREFGLAIDDVELKAGDVTDAIRQEVVKARKQAAYVSTPDEYWKTLDSRSLSALDELHKKGRHLEDLQDRLVLAGVSYGLKESDLRAITDKVKLRDAVYLKADQIIDEAMIKLPLAERRKVRLSEKPILALKRMLEGNPSEEPAPSPAAPEKTGQEERFITMHAAKSSPDASRIDPALPEDLRKTLLIGLNSGLTLKEMQGQPEEVRKIVLVALETRLRDKQASAKSETKTATAGKDAEKDTDFTRRAAEITFARLMKDENSRFEDLNPVDPGKRDERFLEKTRALWKEFAVHGISTLDKKTGKPIILARPDLDGRTCLGLLARAGVDTRDVEFVAPGEASEGRINLDTGYKNGLAVDNGGETAYFDHHAPENGRDTSSAKVTYEVLTKLGLLKREEHLDKLVDFVTMCDNKTHPERFRGFKDSYRTILGLQRYARFYQLEEFFKAGLDPAQPLSEADLKKYGLEKASAEQKAVVEQSEARLKEMEQQGLIIDSKEYGRIVVDIGKTVKGGMDAAGSVGAGCYVIWNPDTQSFFISTAGKPLTEDFGQGRKIRGTMWIKEIHDPAPLRVKLAEVVSGLTGGETPYKGELKRYLDSEAEGGIQGFNRIRVETIGLNAGLTHGEMAKMSDRELVRAARAGWEQRVADYYSSQRLNGEALTEEKAQEFAEAEAALAAAESAAEASPETGATTAVAGSEAPDGKIRIEGRVIDISEVVRNLAMRRAEQQMTDLMNKSHFYSRWWLRMNEKGRLSITYRDALKGISDNKNLLTLIQARMLGRSEVKPGDIDAQYKYLDQILEAYEKDFASAEEKGQILVDPEINAKLADLFYRHAKGEFDDRAKFDQAANAELMPTFERLSKTRKELFTSDENRRKGVEGLMFAQNFWQLAESYKDRIAEVIREHGMENEEAVRNYLNGLMNIDIQLGLKQKELYNNQPEAKLGMLEKLTDKLQAMPFGLGKVLANPILFGGVGSMFGQSAARASVRGMVMAGAYVSGTALFFAPTSAALLAGGLAGGAFMWFRRGRDLKYDRGMDARRLALGELSGGKRTDKIREFSYEMKSAGELTEALNLLTAKDSLSDDEKSTVADIMARLALEKKLNVDLISVSEQAGREGFRITEMNPLLLSLKQVKDKFGLSEDSLRALIDSKEGEIIGQINSQDKRFESFRKWESAKAAIIGGAMGVAGGLLSQWGIDQLRGRVPGFDAQRHGSAIEGLYHHLRGESVYEHAAGPLMPVKLPGTGGSFNLPEGYGIIDQSRGNAHAFGIQDSHGHLIATGLETNGDGQLTAQTLEQLKDKGFEVEDFAKKIRAGDIEIGERMTGQAPSVEEMQRWLPKLSEHARADWHDELGPRYSSFFHKLIEFEGKQQMLYLERDATGAVSVNTEKIAMNLIKNARHAFAEYGTNPDGSVDTKLQHLMTQLESWAKSGELGKHFQAAVIPTAEANGQGLSLLNEGTLPDGRLPLPRETWDLFKNNTNLFDGHLPFKYLELRLDGHVLATAQGQDLLTGSGSPGVRVPFANIPPEIFVHDTNIRPPLHPDAPIPTPFFPRKHLERTPLVPPPQPPYYGYGSATPERIQARMERERIEPSAPEKSRDVRRERRRIEEYLNIQENGYKEELERLEKSVAPMDEKTRVAINIPAYNEESNLRRLLESYTQQIDSKGNPLDPRLYEINFILNRPAGAASDRSAEIISQFRREHPEFKINSVDVEFPKDKAGVGLARKYITDLTLLRSAHRTSQEGALYIQSEDADLLEVDPRVVESVMSKLDRHPELDGLRGQQDRYPEIMMENDMLFLNRRAEDFWEVLMRDKKFRPEGVPDDFVWNRVVTGGWNTAYTAEVYAQIHGYTPLKVGEDMDIGQRISMLRGRKTEGRIVPNVGSVETVATRTHSSPRRFIHSLASGIDPYSDFGNESIKFETNEQLMDKISPYRRLDKSNSAQLERLLEGKYRYMIRNLVKDPKDAEKFFSRLMYHLGFRKEDWSMSENAELRITSLSNVKKALSDYRKNPLYKNKLKIARKEGKKARQPAAETIIRTPETQAAPGETALAAETPLAPEASAAEPAGEAVIGTTPEPLPERAGEGETAPISGYPRTERSALYKERAEYLSKRFHRLDDLFAVQGTKPAVGNEVFVNDLLRTKAFGKAIKKYADDVLTARFRTLDSKIGADAGKRFGAYMDALGFARDDWELDGKNVTVKSVDTLRSASEDYRNSPGKLDARVSAAETAITVPEKPLKKPILDSLKKRSLRVVRERFNFLKKTADSYSELRHKKDLAAITEAENLMTGIYQGLPEGPGRKQEFLKAIQATGLKSEQLSIDDSGNVHIAEHVNQRQLLRRLKPNMFKKALGSAQKTWESHKKDLGL